MRINRKIHTINSVELPVANEISIVIAVPESQLVQGQIVIRRNHNNRSHFVFGFKILLIWFCILFTLFLLLYIIKNI